MNRPFESSPRHLMPIMTAAYLIHAAACAQLADWVSVVASPTAQVQLEQSIIAVRDQNRVHGFSAVTHAWTSITAVAATPTLTIFNEHFIVRDGPVFYGYSPRTGAFAAQATFSPAAVLANAGGPTTWYSAVTDGNNVHVFFALSGQWITFVFASPPTVIPGRLCLLLVDGGTIYGVSAFYESLVPLLVPNATVSGAYGNAAVATSPGSVHGFSAYRNTWASIPFTGPATVTTGHAQPGFVAIRDTTSLAFFSGHTGSFSTPPVSPSATMNLHRETAIVLDGNTVVGYSGMLGHHATSQFSSPPAVHLRDWFALLDDGQGLVAYSAATGTFAAAFSGTWQITSNQQVAAVTAPGASLPTAVYSAYTNTWTLIPALSAATVYVPCTSVILADLAGGLYAFSARGTGWIHQPTPPLDAVQTSFSTFCARAGTTLYSFNPKTVAWRSTDTFAPAVSIATYYGSLIANDGAAAYGFSHFTDRWSAIPLTGPVVSSGVQIQAAVVRESNVVRGYSGLGQMSTTGEYPFFWRTASQGGRLRIELAAEPGMEAFIALSPVAADIPTPYGTLFIDPAAMLLLAQPTLPASGLFTLSLQIPVAPGFSGTEIHFQAAVLGPPGLYLTNSALSTVY
jgi:hypothetical protein